MSLIMPIVFVLIFIIVYKILNDQFSLMLYGVFLAYISINFETYFNTGVAEATYTPFVVIIGLLTALTFGKLIWLINKSKKGDIDGFKDVN